MELVLVLAIESMRATVNRNSTLCRRHGPGKRRTSKFAQWNGTLGFLAQVHAIRLRWGRSTRIGGSLTGLFLALTAMIVMQIPAQELRNFHHTAWPSDSILCAIKFTESHFLLLCEDDGVGIDPQFLSDSGRPGHWGLIGMRERAQKIGATLRAQRSTKGGTEIELRVTARIAYLKFRAETE
jgi:two-component sensor histidine kinase